LSVLIIARPNRRSAIEAKKVLSPEFNVQIIEATTPANLSGLNIYPARNVEPIEVAISVSHHRARLEALKSENEWAIILEEDAIVKFNLLKFETLIKSVIKTLDAENSLIGIHLFPEQYGILTGKQASEHVRVWYVPDFAVGYVLNLGALKYAVENFDFQAVEVADWPRFMRKKIKWFAPVNSLVVHPDLNLKSTESSTRVYRNIRTSSRKLKKYFNKRNLILIFLKIGKILNLCHGKNPIASEKIRSIRLYF